MALIDNISLVISESFSSIECDCYL